MHLFIFQIAFLILFYSVFFCFDNTLLGLAMPSAFLLAIGYYFAVVCFLCLFPFPYFTFQFCCFFQRGSISLCQTNKDSDFSKGLAHQKWCFNKIIIFLYFNQLSYFNESYIKNDNENSRTILYLIKTHNISYLWISSMVLN